MSHFRVATSRCLVWRGPRAPDGDVRRTERALLLG